MINQVHIVTAITVTHSQQLDIIAHNNSLKLVIIICNVALSCFKHIDCLAITGQRTLIHVQLIAH